MVDSIMKTPGDFIDYYWTGLKEDLQKYDIQISKLGMIGYILNILGWTTYDLKNYYDNLFKESFVATSREEDNLRMHASIYGYQPDYALCAKATGEFVFDFSGLANLSKDIVKREIIFTDIKFNIAGKDFLTESEYHFVQENTQHYCMIYNKGGINFVPSSIPVVKAPFYEVFQLTKEIKELIIQNYDFGTYCPFSIDLKEKYLHSLKLRVGEQGEIFDPESGVDSFGEPYEIKPVKYLNGSTDKVAFIRSSSIYDYLLEFGSGIKGNYVPNRSGVATIYSTDGFKGNINTPSKPSIDSCSIYMKLYKSDNSIITSNISRDYLKILFDYSEGGKNQLSGEELRKSIVRHIQTRDNFINEQDFYNICIKYMDDFRFMFRKSSFVDNTFYLERCFRDRYQQVAYATNITQELIAKYVEDEITFIIDNAHNNVIDGRDDFLIKIPDPSDFPIRSNTNSDIILDGSHRFIYSIHTPLDEYIEGTSIYKSAGEPMYGGLLTEGTYYYIVKAADNFKEYQIGNTIEVQLNGISQNAAKLSWDAIPGATKYVIYGRPNRDGHYRTWTVFDTTFIDIGSEGIPSVPVCSTRQFVFYPEYLLYGREFISPFVYEYDSYMGWYKSYLLYTNFMIYFNNIKDKNTDYPIPVIFFNIIYNKAEYKTKIYIKSYQDISKYKLTLVAQGLNIAEQVTTNIDQNTWLFEYIDSKHSIIWETTSLELTVMFNGVKLMIGQTSEFRQIYDITEQLKLLKYDSYADGKTYITNVPIIDKELYYSDETYYANKIHEFLYSNNFSENRMITDELQFRFLNTFVVPANFMKVSTKQKYNFDLHLPLRIKINAYIDEDYISNNIIDLNTEKNLLIDKLATELQTKYTGSNIVYYNSRIDDFVHTNREFIKRVEVIVSDGIGNILKTGIEVNSDKLLLEEIATNETIDRAERKLQILKYVPPYFYWDINNIDLQFLFQ